LDLHRRYRGRRAGRRGSSPGYEIINLGRGEPVPLADFIRLVEEVTGRQANLIPKPMPLTDVAYTYADITAKPAACWATIPRSPSRRA